MVPQKAKLHWRLLAGALLLICVGADRAIRHGVTSKSIAAVRIGTADGLAEADPGISRYLAQRPLPPESSRLESSRIVSSRIGGQHQAADQHQASSRSAQYLVTIRKPAGPPRLDLGMLDATGEQLTAACSTCHTTRLPNQANRSPIDLDEFHQSIGAAISVVHGKVSCLSCHNPDDYDTLRLADGTPVEYTEVMTLCSQCHGAQARDYQHGAHGGMNGYWDLSRGPRTRNNCVDCHDPHAPSFPTMKPTFKPRDRFLSSGDKPGADRHE